MKRVILLIGILLGAAVARADQDRFGSMRPALWRSSFTMTADSRVSVASGAWILHGVIAATASPNSYIYIFDNSTFTAALTTVAVVDCTTARPPLYYDLAFSTGLGYSTIGNCPFTILWDWQKTRFPR